MGFTCPVCGRTSHSPDDMAEGYCANCHDWTGRLADGKILVTGCPCGETHAVSQHAWGLYVGITARIPAENIVCLGGINYRIPHLYIALHGLRGEDFPDLAGRYGFRRSS